MTTRAVRTAARPRVEWAWAAGLFEGEGCVFISGRGQPLIAIKMADEDVLRRFAAIVGVGRVTGPYEGQEPHHKPIWGWTVRSWPGVAHVLIGMAPWLGERRRAKATGVMRQRPLDSWLPGYTKRLRTHCKRGHLLPGKGPNLCRICRAANRKRWAQTPKGKAWRERARLAERARRAAA